MIKPSIVRVLAVLVAGRIAVRAARRARGAPGIGRVGKDSGYTYRYATRHPRKRGLY